MALVATVDFYSLYPSCPYKEGFVFLLGGWKNQKSLVGVDQKKPLLPGFILEYT